LYRDFVALKPTLQQLETDTDNPSRRAKRGAAGFTGIFEIVAAAKAEVVG
jgi:hypothetical protein